MSSTKFEGCHKCHNANIYIYKQSKREFHTKIPAVYEYHRKQVHYLKPFIKWEDIFN